MDSTEAQPDVTGDTDEEGAHCVGEVDDGESLVVEAIEDGLPSSARQEQFSIAYTHMVVSAAGCSIKYHSTDYDGVDITIASSAQYETVFGPQFELQLKCTTQRDLLTPDFMTWSLKSKPFKKLTRKRYLPAYLGVLLVPDDPELLLEHDESRLLTQSCMYWQRAEALGEIGDTQKTKTVRLPRSNIFTADQLLGIMKELAEGGDW